MKKLENLTKEELIEVIALKTEMLTDEDEQITESANLEAVCELISLMCRIENGTSFAEFKNAIERAYEYYVEDYGIDADEMAEHIGITAEELNEIAGTITDVEDAEEMGWFDE